jgi:hypothetical protein
MPLLLPFLSYTVSFKVSKIISMNQTLNGSSNLENTGTQPGLVLTHRATRLATIDLDIAYSIHIQTECYSQ